MSGAQGTKSQAISWRWSFFLLGVVYALPAVIVIPFRPVAGLALAVGVLPVAAFRLPGSRRGRRVIPVVGLLSAASFIIGSFLTQVPALAVVAMFGLAIGFVLWARHAPAGALALALVLPLVGIALSYDDIRLAAVIGALVLAGSLYAWGVAMLWPERGMPPPARESTPTRGEALTYGVLLGAAAATAAGIGYAWGLEHIGWATGAVLLVMRPARDQLILRSAGRAVSVVVGALAAASMAFLSPVAVVTAVIVGLALAALSATQLSRWYVAPGFITFVVLTLLLQGPGESPAERFAERTLETAIGVGLALLFGALVPVAIAAARKRADTHVRT